MSPPLIVGDKEVAPLSSNAHNGRFSESGGSLTLTSTPQAVMSRLAQIQFVSQPRVFEEDNP